MDKRAGLAVAAVAALGASFVAGAAVAGWNVGGDPGGDRGSTRTVAGPRHPFALPNDDTGGGLSDVLSVADSCDDLLDWYVERGVDRVGPWGWDSPVVIYEQFAGDPGLDRATGLAEDGVSAAGSKAATSRAESSGTGTNVQEAGVDEPDVVKTDGELLVRVQDDELTTYDVSGSRPEQLESVTLPGIADPEVLLVDDRVVVTGRDARSADPDDAASTRVLFLDVTDPESPQITDTFVYDSALVTARQHGDTVRLVLDAGLPDLRFVAPGDWGRSEESALRRNRAIVAATTIEDWLPSVTTYDEDGGDEQQSTEPLLDCEQVALPEDDAGLGTLAVVGFDAADAATWSTTGVATSSDLAYFSVDRMYLATTPASADLVCCWDGGGRIAPEPDDGVSRLYAFTLDGTDATYASSGEVDGIIADRWAMDEFGDVLRVAVGPTSRTGNFNSVVTFREAGDDLVELGRVDKLGVNETIRSMRWFDGLAIMVTFRQVDPLYAVDLTDPARPALLGKLKIPGFSEYLHPLGPHRLVGVGQDASLAGQLRGAQSALFSVTDLTDPRQLDVVRYRKNTVAGAATDPRQFTWLPDKRTVLTVITEGYDGRTAWVSVLELADGQMENRMVEVEYGVEVDQVRLVPLPDRRVVLVTGDAVSFFDV